MNFSEMREHAVEAMAPNSSSKSGGDDFTAVLLDPIFVSQVINCQKPLISGFNLLIFVFGCKRHRQLLKTLNVVDNALFNNFTTDPNIECLNMLFIVMAVVTFVAPLTLRITQALVMEERLGEFWLIDCSFILVPLWSIAILLPLYYFELVSRVIRYWCYCLSGYIKENYQVSFQPRPLKFYYLKFIEIINVQTATMRFFGCFMLWSLCWSVFTVAMAIYFATQTNSVIPAQAPDVVKTAMYFVVMWSAIQISYGIFYMLVICASGTATNEAMRSVLASVQDIVTDIETDDDKFQVECFTNKIALQSEWGMTIAGAFNLERGFLFSLLGVITTYALVLLELKGGGAGDTDVNPELVAAVVKEMSETYLQNPGNGQS